MQATLIILLLLIICFGYCYHNHLIKKTIIRTCVDNHCLKKNIFQKFEKNWFQNFQNSSDYYDFYLEPSHKIVVSHYVEFYLEGTLSLSVRVYVTTTEIK